MKTQHEVISSLEAYLKALRAMEPLEPSAIKLSDEEEAAWQDQHKRIQGLLEDARLEVEALLPPDVRLMLTKVRLQAYGLYGPREKTRPEVE